MKRLFLIVAIIVCGISSILAQNTPCNISTGGLELRNAAGTATVASMPADGTGYIRMPLQNTGIDPTCGYLPGQVTAALYFFSAASPNNVVRYNGPAQFTFGKFTFTYNANGDNELIGVNNDVLYPGLANVQSVLIPIAGVKIGTASFIYQLQSTGSSDNTSDNNGFISIVVGPSLGVLPVSLNSIDGLSDKCNAQVKWSTSNESNLNKFEIEVSKNGVDFDRAGTVKPSGSNGGNYQFNTTQSSGKSYYRLKIIDRDGSFTYSKVVPIATSCNDKVVKVFPNPVKLDQLLNVNISGYDASVKGDLYSSTGQFVKTYVLKNGANNLSVENLAQGFYTLRVSENGSVTETFKLNVLQ